MQEPSVQEPTPVNYKETLSLPQTAFKMKAGAATREVELEAFWETENVYSQQVADHKAAGAPHFVLHDGPPYLSSDKIHIGTALNKILKDVITRYKSQRGFYTPYVPGYDGHGLPIETAVVKTLKGGRHSISAVELRQRCRDFAMSNLKGQETNFRRLGIWGHWEKPYVTIDPAFEATQIKVFGDIYKKGFVYKGLKPVYWCPHCETALAEAEVEYGDHVSNSIYVKFPFSISGNETVLAQNYATVSATQSEHAEPLPDKATLTTALDGASFVIWTTTPWSLPANIALALHPEYRYSVIEAGEIGCIVLAEDRLQPFLAQVGIDAGSVKVLATFPGKLLELVNAQHPFLDRASLVLLGEHVTLDAGTGVVHTAPGHGMDDYLMVQTYNRTHFAESPLPILSPVDNAGKFTVEAGVPELEGAFYEKANAQILELLQSKNALVFATKFSHSYPHCWRCHNPVMYRATEQWFIDINKFRTDALTAVDQVNWLPERGRNRIYSMVEGRGDWCLSRQRVWGVPIPVLYCADPNCRSVLLTDATIDCLYEQFKVHSSDIWWGQSADELIASLPVGERTCSVCGGQSFEKEMDIMDVWFDSGITHTAVVAARSQELGTLPVAMYLEGSDQHRGWFQSSLLTSVMLYGKAPYENVMTHGFVLDEQGRKMSKSLGNVVDPNTVIREYGADVLRLWVASVDYTNDVRIGKNTLHQMAEIYKKVRNTVRFILGNLHDFNPVTDRVEDSALSSLDKYTRHRLSHILGNITDAFEQWEFYRYSHEIQYLCMADLSQLYFDVTKDILYCDKTDAPRRRAVQTVLHDVLMVILPVLVPVTPHLAEDIWQSLPETQRVFRNGQSTPVSATLLPWPNPEASATLSAEDIVVFEQMLAIKEAVNQALEVPRSEGHIGSSLEATVMILPGSDACKQALAAINPAEWPVLLITASATLVSEPPEVEATGWHTRVDGDGFSVFAVASKAAKCQRCWKYEPTVGDNASHPALCSRCSEAVG